MDLVELDRLVKAEVLDVFDHRNLNVEIPQFAGIVPTSENLAVYIWNQLRPTVAALSAVTVWEIADAKCTYRGP